MRKGVHGRPAALGTGEAERQRRLVHDPLDERAAAGALAAGLGVARPEAGRPLGTAVGRRDRDDPQAGLGGDGLRAVDGAPPADRHQAVGTGLPGGRESPLDASRVGMWADARIAQLDWKLEPGPALGRDHERAFHPELAEDGR
jgi:hypothetical protein